MQLEPLGKIRELVVSGDFWQVSFKDGLMMHFCLKGGNLEMFCLHKV